MYITDAEAAARQGARVVAAGEGQARRQDFIAVVKVGQEPGRGAGVRAKVLSPQGQATLQAAGSASRDDRRSQRRTDGRDEPPWYGALGRAAVVIGATIVIAVVMAFLLLPIVALFTYQPVHDLFDGFGTKVATDAILVSLKTNAIAFALMIALGTPFAYMLARPRFRGRSLVITLVELPLVMPPAVAGLGLLVAFGRFGLLGHTLSVLGIDLAFTQAAVVIAILFVASPFYLRGAIAAFEARRLDAARRRRDARRRPGAPDAAGRDPARRRRARRGGGGRVRARDRRVRRDDPVRRQLPGDHPNASARRLLAVRRQSRPGDRDRRAADNRERRDPAGLEAAVRSWTSSTSTSPSPGGRSIFAPR